MAESLLDSFLTCPVCLQTFTEPLTLGCGHAFCSSCVHQYWLQQLTKSCPICRQKSSNEHPPVNFALKELSEQFKQSLQLSATPNIEEKKEERKEVLRSVCPSHPQVPPLFCLDDVRPLCPLCEFSLHPQHKVVRAEWAEGILKEQIISQLQTLTEQRQSCEQQVKNYEEVQRFTEEQTWNCEHQIRAVFFRLQRFLEKEEQRALSALKDEQNRLAQSMGPCLHSLRERLSSLNHHIQELEKQLKSEDLVHSYSPLALPRASPGLPLNQLTTEVALDQARVLGNLGFKVWSRMRKEVQFRPIILDPNTASPCLRLSEDLSGVRYEGTKQELPDYPQRFTYFDSVMGIEGLSCGSHQWEVEVGDHQNWFVGVSKESVNRKEESEHVPQTGHWCVSHYGGKYFDVFFKVLTLQTNPERIRVQLDYDRGQLTFSDADHKTLICSYTGTFTDKLFPYFSVGKAGDAKAEEIRIASFPLAISVQHRNLEPMLSSISTG